MRSAERRRISAALWCASLSAGLAIAFATSPAPSDAGSVLRPCCGPGSSCCGPPGPPGEPCLLTYGVSGTVRDSVTGMPIAGATITLNNLPVVSSAADGTFSVNGSQEDTCNIDYCFFLTVSAPGHSDFEESPCTNAVIMFRDVELEPTGGSPTPTPCANPTCTPGSCPSEPCAGDCDGDGRVVIDEIVLGVGIALGETASAACAAIDVDGDSKVEISELVQSVANALDGCRCPAASIL
jgi:hypothetical protein